MSPILDKDLSLEENNNKKIICGLLRHMSNQLAED